MCKNARFPFFDGNNGNADYLNGQELEIRGDTLRHGGTCSPITEGKRAGAVGN